LFSGKSWPTNWGGTKKELASLTGLTGWLTANWFLGLVLAYGIGLV